MLWYLLTLAATPTDPARWFAIKYQNELQCQKDLADKLVERRREIAGMVLLETCVPAR